MIASVSSAAGLSRRGRSANCARSIASAYSRRVRNCHPCAISTSSTPWSPVARSEEHTSELQSRSDLVCRLLLEKKKQTVTTNLLKFMRASIKMIGVSNLQSFIASMTQKLTLSDISDESKNYLDKAGITTACLRIKSKWTAGGK